MLERNAKTLPRQPFVDFEMIETPIPAHVRDDVAERISESRRSEEELARLERDVPRVGAHKGSLNVLDQFFRRCVAMA
jgi:hypothetical protein